MSASVLSIRMIGYKIPAERLSTERRASGCDHLIVGKFCGECGAPRWRYKTERALHDSDDVGEFTLRTEGWDERGIAYIGLELESRFVSIDKLVKLTEDITQVRSNLEAELDQRGIRYDDCPFGLHLIAELC